MVLVDFPVTASFLTPEERAFVIWKKSKFLRASINVGYVDIRFAVEYDNSSVGEEQHFELRHVREAFLDWQVWSLSLINVVSAFAGM